MQFSAENLQAPAVRQAFAATIKQRIDDYCVKQYAQDFMSRRMATSEIAHECEAYLWYKFRWVAKQKPASAQKLRLFNRGNREEIKFVEYLKGAGFKVWDIDPNANDKALNKQFRMRAIQDHLGGYLDGIGQSELCNVPLLLEFKTMQDKDFKQLLKQGIEAFRPKHFGQMVLYGYDYNFDYGLYFAINKDDDDMYVECVYLDKAKAQHLLYRAEHIIRSPVRPTRIAETPAYWQCKHCEMAGVCHHQQLPMKNCRSCIFAVPLEKGEWFCEQHKRLLKYDEVPLGCKHHQPIK